MAQTAEQKTPEVSPVAENADIITVTDVLDRTITIPKDVNEL